LATRAISAAASRDHAREQGAQRAAGDRLLIAGGAPPRAPISSARPANRQTFSGPLRAAKEPQSPGMPSTLCISVCRAAAGAGNQFAPPDPDPKGAHCTRSRKNRQNRKEPFSEPARIGSQFNLCQGVLLLGWAAALLAGPPPEVGELFKRKLGSCSRGSLVKIVTQVREGHTIEVGGLAIRLQGLAAPERDGRVAPRQPKLCVPSCSVAVRCELGGHRTHDRCVAVSLPPSGSHRGGNGAPGSCSRLSNGRYRSAEIHAATDGANIGKNYVLPEYCRLR
jgi:hypothetical protein